MAHILIIDDDVQIREMLRKMFEKEGFGVTDAPNGKEGLKLQNKNPAEVIITDIIMPEKEGLETIREIKSDFPETKVIAISGGGFIGPDSYLSVAQMMGATLTFRKPIKTKELLKAVNGLIKDERW